MMSALYMMKLTIIYNTCTVYAITSAAFYFGLRNMLFLLFYYMMEIYYLSGYNRIATLNNIIFFISSYIFFILNESWPKKINKKNAYTVFLICFQFSIMHYCISSWLLTVCKPCNVTAGRPIFTVLIEFFFFYCMIFWAKSLKIV